jgi:hypothetical protein
MAGEEEEVMMMMMMTTACIYLLTLSLQTKRIVVIHLASMHPPVS